MICRAIDVKACILVHQTDGLEYGGSLTFREGSPSGSSIGLCLSFVLALCSKKHKKEKKAKKRKHDDDATSSGASSLSKAMEDDCRKHG